MTENNMYLENCVDMYADFKHYTKEELEDLWMRFGDVPMNPDTECLEEPFFLWDAGINREDIWHWFDQRYPGGVVSLMYN